MIEIEIATDYGKVNVVSFGKQKLPKYQGQDWNAYTKQTLCELCDIPEQDVYALTQVHGKKILSADKNFPETESISSFSAPEADGLYSEQPGKLLAIRTADCVPVMIWDYSYPFIAALHIGWKGASQGILDMFFEIYENFRIDRYGKTNISPVKNSNPKLGFYIGPCIAGKTYEVDKSVYDAFDTHSAFSRATSGKTNHYQLDLKQFIQEKIRSIHPQAMVLEAGDNTFQSSEWFSHRAGEEGRNLHGIRFFALS